MIVPSVPDGIIYPEVRVFGTGMVHMIPLKFAILNKNGKQKIPTSNLKIIETGQNQ